MRGTRRDDSIVIRRPRSYRSRDRANLYLLQKEATGFVARTNHNITTPPASPSSRVQLGLSNVVAAVYHSRRSFSTKSWHLKTRTLHLTHTQGEFIRNLL